MKKILFLIAAALFAGAGTADAQLIDGSSEAVVQRYKPEEKAVEGSQPAADEVAPEGEPEDEVATEEEIQALLKIKDQPSPTIEPSRKVYLKSEGKKDVKETIKAQKEEKDRNRMVDAVTRVERVQKRRQALLEGKNRNEALQEAEEIKRPKVNVKNDMALSEYFYEKVGLNDKD